MAVTKDDLLIKIQADTSSASAAIDDLSGEFKKFSTTLSATSKKTAEVADQFSGFAGKAILFNQSISAISTAYNQFLKPLATSIMAYKEAEDAVNKLTATLQMLGDTAAEETANSFAKLSDSIEKQIGIQAELVLQMQASAKAAGLTNEEVVKITKTAANFASGAGISFNQAFLGLQKSLKGTGLELATYMPALAKMTREQFMAGEGIDAISKKYQGFADIVAGTFQMSVNRGEIAIGDFQKALGRILTDIFPIDSGFKSLISTLNAFVVFFDKLPTELGGFTTAYQVIKSGLQFLISAFDSTFDNISKTIILFIEGTTVAFNGFVTGILYAWRELQSILATTGLIDESAVAKTTALIDSFAEKTKQSVNGVTIAFKRLNEVFAKTKAPEIATGAIPAAEVVAGGAVSILDDKAQKELDTLRAKTIELQNLFNSFNKTQREQIQSKIDAEIKILEIQKAQLEKQREMSQAAEVAKQIALKREIGAQQVSAAPSTAFESMKMAGEKIAGEISGVFSEGLAGSVAGAVSAANAVADAVLALINMGPDLLNKIAAIFDGLADLPTKLLEGLMNIDLALEKFISKFPEALTQLLSKLPEIIASILEKLGALAPTVLSALIKAVPAFVKALVKQAPRIAVAIVKGMVDALGSVFSDFFGGGSIKVDAIDPEPITTAVKQGIATLTSEASKTFAVLDLKQAAKKGKSVTQQLEDTAIEIESRQRSFFQELLNDLERAFSGLWGIIKEFANLFSVENLTRGFKSAGKVLETMFYTFVNLLKGLFNAVIPTLSAIFTGIGRAITGFVRMMEQLGGEIWRGFENAAKSGWNLFKEIGEKVGKALGDAFLGIIDFILKPINELIDLLKGKSIKSKAESAWGKVEEFAKDPAGTTAREIKSWFATGGLIPAYAANGMMMPYGTDTIPAMLTPGEFVMSRGAVNRFGIPFMEQINSGVTPRQISNGSTTVNVSVNITSNGQLDENFIRSRLMPTIKNEFRRASLDGQFVISAKGVR